MTLGQAIRHLRQARGLSQAQLASDVSISPSYLSLLEGDRREASIALLRALADRLGSPSFLLLAHAIAGTSEDPVAKHARRLLDDLTELVGAKGLPLGLDNDGA